MAFMIKKKRYKFQVNLCLEELSEVTYSKAILFAKVRQLEGGHFSDVSKRMEVQNHRVQYNARFSFLCKMNASSSSGVLDSSKCRISIRMEEKGGRHFRKLGFTDINLAEYAGAGPSTQRYILQPYDLNHRLDNSILQVTLNITLKEGDTIFQRPLTRMQPILLPGEEEKRRNNSLPNPGLVSSLSIPTADLVVGSEIGAAATVEDPSHTRNSSTTSQASAGYSSQNSQPGHSRQSSSGGESSHGSRRVTDDFAWVALKSHSVLTRLGYTGSIKERTQKSSNPAGHCLSNHRRCRSYHITGSFRNLSQGSPDTGFYGSMEKEKRRKKLDDGRIAPEDVINELMEGVDLKQDVNHDEAETSGLTLYVGPDNTVSFDKRGSRKHYEPVVMRR